MNGSPEELVAPFLDRFGIRVCVNRPPPGALDSLKHAASRAIADIAYKDPDSILAQFREIRNFDGLLTGDYDMSALECAQVIWPRKGTDILRHAQVASTTTGVNLELPPEPPDEPDDDEYTECNICGENAHSCDCDSCVDCGNDNDDCVC
jgi:hypothetical protein